MRKKRVADAERMKGKPTDPAPSCAACGAGKPKPFIQLTIEKNYHYNEII